MQTTKSVEQTFSIESLAGRTFGEHSENLLENGQSRNFAETIPGSSAIITERFSLRTRRLLRNLLDKVLSISPNAHCELRKLG